MKSLSAKDAKNNFGVLMDTVQREPVSIKKHGRPFAVVLSDHDYKELKLYALRKKLQEGEEQANRGEFAQYSFESFIGELDTELNQSKT